MKDLRIAQFIMKDILDYIVKICDENDIVYWLDAGTLLGAVRHKGFIPWDDDIDIIMPKADFLKFIKIFKKYENDEYKLITKSSKGYRHEYIKVVNNYHISKNSRRKYHKGIWVDIFPVDFYREDKILKNYIAVLKELKKEKKKLRKFILKLKLKFLKSKLLKEQNKGENKFFAYDLNAWEYDIILEYNTIFPLQKITFEKSFYNVPHNYEKYLTDIYGDYMKIPKQDKQVTHNLEGFEFDLAKLRKYSEE